jgi:hypothetical protein
MEPVINHPERLNRDIDLFRIAKKKPKQETEVRSKRHWEEEAGSKITVPVVSSLPSFASQGELVYCNGLYIYVDWWISVSSGGGGGTTTTTEGGTVPPTGFIILPEPEAVYATKTGGGNVYVAVSNGGRMRRLVFDATSLPSSDASATFAMTAGFDSQTTYDLLFSVVSNQNTKNLYFSVYTDRGYDFVIETDGTGTGSTIVEIKGNPTIMVTRRYTSESGLVYPCWTACGLVLFQRG